MLLLLPIMLLFPLIFSSLAMMNSVLFSGNDVDVDVDDDRDNRVVDKRRTKKMVPKTPTSCFLFLVPLL